MPKRHSPILTEEDAAIIKLLLKLHVIQHDIAARFHTNQGRISEINTGKKFAHVVPANDLPAAFIA